MKVNGSCHCGQIAYEAAIDPKNVSLCNCTDCQMLTGVGVSGLGARPKGRYFRLSKGQPSTYIKTAESGSKRIHAFCPNCGTPVYASANMSTIRRPIRCAPRLPRPAGPAGAAKAHLVQIRIGVGAGRERVPGHRPAMSAARTRPRRLPPASACMLVQAERGPPCPLGRRSRPERAAFQSAALRAAAGTEARAPAKPHFEQT